jgi:predicted dehydrogenase
MAHERVKLAVIGCGTMGRIHLQGAALSGRAQLVAVADAVSELAQQAARAHDVPAVYAAGESAIDDPNVQAVILAVPTAGRAALAARALRAGKHVLLEKPSGLCAREIGELIEAGSGGSGGGGRGGRGGVGASCSSRYRFTPVADVAARAVADGLLGEIRLIRAAVLDAAPPAPAPPPSPAPAPAPQKKPPPAWRVSKSLNGGGILANWGSYDIDFLLGVLGWRARPITGFGATWGVADPMRQYVAEGSDAETLAAGLIRFDDGSAMELIRGEFLPMHAQAAWQIIGTRGTLRLGMLADAQGAGAGEAGGAGGEVILDTAAPSGGIHSAVLWRGRTAPMDPHYGPINDFLQAIQTGGAPRTDLRKAFIVQSIIDAVYQSAEAGQSVSIPQPPVPA